MRTDLSGHDEYDDEWAGELLLAAAETIDVPPGLFVAPAARPRWIAPLAAAAAVVVLLGVAGFVATRDADRVPDPLPAPAVSPASPTATETQTSLPHERETIAASGTQRTDYRPVEEGLMPLSQEDLTRIANRFVAGAKQDEVVLTNDGPVELYVGDKHVATVSNEDSTKVSAYDVCVDGYAARACPLNAVETLASVTQSGLSFNATRAICDVTDGWPRELDGYYLISVEFGGDCAEWGSVTLFVNDAGQVVAIDLSLAEP